MLICNLMVKSATKTKYDLWFFANNWPIIYVAKLMQNVQKKYNEWVKKNQLRMIYSGNNAIYYDFIVTICMIICAIVPKIVRSRCSLKHLSTSAIIYHLSNRALGINIFKPTCFQAKFAIWSTNISSKPTLVSTTMWRPWPSFRVKTKVLLPSRRVKS